MSGPKADTTNSVPARKSALGTQPQRDGLIVCLICDRAFRWLGPHLRQRHGVSVEEYKEQFELPRRGLLSDSSRQKRREHALHLLATDERVRAGLLGNDPAAERRWLKRARKAASAAYAKAGVRAILADNARHAAAVSAQKRRDAHEQRARELGHASLADLLAASVYLSNPQLAQLLGCSTTRASRLRRSHGAPSQYRAFQQVATQAHRKATKQQAFEQHLTQLPPAAQPRDQHGRWICRICSIPAASLATHAQQAHQLTPAKYLHRVRLRHRLDEAAQAAGYRDAVDLFQQTLLDSRGGLAAMLGLSRRSIANLHSYFPDLPTRTEQQAKQSRTLAAVRAQSGKRQRAHQNYDQLARMRGHASVEEMMVLQA